MYVSQRLDKQLWVRVAPSRHHAAFSRMLRRSCASAAVTSGSWMSLYSDQGLLQREAVLQLKAQTAAGK